MNDNDELLYLIANPIKKKKTYVFTNIDEEICILLHKKYKNYYFDEIIYKEICEKNKEIVIDYTIKKIVNKIMNEIFDKILLEYP